MLLFLDYQCSEVTSDIHRVNDELANIGSVQFDDHFFAEESIEYKAVYSLAPSAILCPPAPR